MNKPVYKSMTIWSGGLWALTALGEAYGVVPSGAAMTLSPIFGFGTVYGLRRAKK